MSDILATSARVNGADLEFVEKATGNIPLAIRSGATVDLSGATTFTPQTGGVQYKKVTLTTAQVKALHGTPVTLVADPGAGKFIELVDALLFVNFATTQYAAGSTVQFLENSVAVATTTAALINAAASATADIIQPAFPSVGTTAAIGAANSALTITASAGEFTTGDSPINVHIWYAVVTL